METQYRVVLSGQLKPGWTLEKSTEALANIMGCDIEHARQIIATAPKKLKKIMPLKTAQMYKNKLEQTGIICAVQPHFSDEEIAAEENATMGQVASGAAVGAGVGAVGAVGVVAGKESAATQTPNANNTDAMVQAEEEAEEDFTVDMGSEKVKKLIKNTYNLLGATLVVSAVAAFIGMGQSMEGVSNLMVLIVSLVLLGVTYFTRNSVYGIVSIFAFTGWMGYWIGPVLSFYLTFSNGAELIGTAAGMTAVVFFGLSGYVLLSKRDFSFMGSFLFAGLVVVIAGLLFSLFFNIPGIQLAISCIAVLIFSGYILYDTSEMIHGGETNYIMATVSLYLDIINLFLHLLRILAAFTGED